MLLQNDKNTSSTFARKSSVLSRSDLPTLVSCCIYNVFTSRRSSQTHMKIAHRALRYLQGKINIALKLKLGQDDQLRAYIDSMLGNEVKKKRSCSWRIVILSGKQPFTLPVSCQIAPLLFRLVLNMWLYLRPVRQATGCVEIYRSLVSSDMRRMCLKRNRVVFRGWKAVWPNFSFEGSMLTGFTIISRIWSS